MCSLWAATAIAAPRIECEEPKYDFGTVIGRNQISHEFIIWNRGDEPLVISKIKNCCGTKSKIDPMTIPPGSNAVCTTVFTTKNRYGEQDKQILLITNDKKHLYYDLRMTGTLLKPIEFSPRLVRLGDLMPDGTISETITATNLLDKAVTLESVSTTIKGLDAEIVENDCRSGMVEDLPAAVVKEAGRSEAIPALQNNAKPQRNWTIQLKSTEPLAVGKINGQVQLKFSTGTIDVPVVGTVNPIIQATPDKIQLSSGSSKEVERLLMFRSGDGRPFEILSAQLENTEGAVESKKLADGKWQIKLSIQPGSIAAESCLRVITSIGPESMRIPLSRRNG